MKSWVPGTPSPPRCGARAVACSPSLLSSRAVGQTIIEGMGELHLDIICDRMKREFKVECDIGPPQVAYREAISRPCEIEHTHKKQSGGSGQFAKIKVKFEPLDGEEGASGFEFAQEIKGGAVPKEYIPGVAKGLESIMGSGILALPSVTIADFLAVIIDCSSSKNC